MKIFMFLIMLALFANESLGEDWHCRDGKTYTNVRYMRHNATAVQFSHESGITTEPFTNLPDDVQEKYGYNPQIAAATIKETAKRRRYATYLNIKYDEFTDISYVRLKNELTMIGRRGILNTSAFWYRGDGNKISFYFKSTQSTSEDWRFLNSHSVYILADKVRFNPEEEYDSDIWLSSNTLFEGVSILLTEKQMDAIVHAKSVRFKIGVEVFQFSKNDQMKLGILLEYMRDHYYSDD